MPPLDVESRIDFAVDVMKDNRLFIRGTTNLPPGAQLMVSVTEVGGPGCQGEARVGKDGTFEAGPFGPDGGLPTGSYVAEVLMPISAVQAESVQAAVGSKGQKLRGPQVESSAVGKVVRSTQAVTLGGSGGTKQQQDRFADEAKNLRAVLNELNSILQKLRAARRSRFDDARLGEFTRGIRSRLQSLGEEFPKPAPGSAAFHLNVAAGDLEVMLLDLALGKWDEVQDKLVVGELTQARKKIAELERRARPATTQPARRSSTTQPSRS